MSASTGDTVKAASGHGTIAAAATIPTTHPQASIESTDVPTVTETRR